jgi:hypothetical protein
MDNVKNLLLTSALCALTFPAFAQETDDTPSMSTGQSAMEAGPSDQEMSGAQSTDHKTPEPAPEPLGNEDAPPVGTAVLKARIKELRVEFQQLEKRAANVEATEPAKEETLQEISAIEEEITRLQKNAQPRQWTIKNAQFFLDDISSFEGDVSVDLDPGSLDISPRLVATTSTLNAYSSPNPGDDTLTAEIRPREVLLEISSIPDSGFSFVWMFESGYAFVLSQDITPMPGVQ